MSNVIKFGDDNAVFGNFLWGQLASGGLTDSLDYEWDTEIYWLYNRWFFLQSDQAIAPANTSSYYVYVDGTLKGTSSTEMEIQTSVIEPIKEKKSSLEVFLSTNILTDDDGSLTGVIGRKYIKTNYYPISIDLVITDGIDTTSISSKLENRNIIDLGVTNDIIYTSITYTYEYDFQLLGVIETDNNEIIGIDHCGRVGNGARLHSNEVNNFGFEVRIPNSGNFSTSVKENIWELLHYMKPAHHLGFLFFEGYSGSWDFYKKI